MKKKLPTIKKSLKSFILEEDAKVIDKSAIKIAGMVTMIGFAVTSMIDDANAIHHKNKMYHYNDINIKQYHELHIGENPTELRENGIPPKSVVTAHSNHYNHKDGNSFLGAIFRTITFQESFSTGTGSYASGDSSSLKISEITYAELNEENYKNPTALENYNGVRYR